MYLSDRFLSNRFDLEKSTPKVGVGVVGWHFSVFGPCVHAGPFCPAKAFMFVFGCMWGILMSVYKSV